MLPAMRVRPMPVAACLLVAGCASPGTLRDDIQASIRKCGLEGQMRVEVERERRARIRYLDPNTDYTKVDCFLADARRLRLELGAVGNEAPSTTSRH
jgi:hypothetical protein